MEKFLRIYKKGMDFLVRIESAIVMVGMAFLILINAVGIFTRYFLNRPILWVHELTILSGTWFFYIGVGILFAKQGDITWEVIVKKMPEKAQRVVDLIINGIVLAFLVLLAISTYRLIPFVTMQGSMLSFDLGIPDVFYYVPVGVGAVLMFIPILYKTLEAIKSNPGLKR
jgi:TRAP-type C4-dicarboxylate transport system permease small subunit